MDELSEKLAALLNDPESLKGIKQMAESLMGSDEPPQEKGEEESFLDGIDIGKLMSIISSFNNMKADNNTKLLSALKPHLSEPKREKVDTAIKILKLLEILPVVKELGLF